MKEEKGRIGLPERAGILNKTRISGLAIVFLLLAGAVTLNGQKIPPQKPKLIVGIYESLKEGNNERANQYQRDLAPLRIAFGLGTFPVVVKEALNMMGLPGGRCRKPIQPLSDEKRAQLRDILVKMEIIPA